VRVKGQLWSFFVAATLLISSPMISPVAEARENGAPAIPLSNIRIDNFGRIANTYYRGEQPEGRDYADLATLGVKTVIDLQADGDNQDEGRLVEDAGMTFVRIPMLTRVAPTQEQIDQFLQIVKDPARQPVYVHCKGGRHRTGVMTAIYRMEQDGWTPDRAFKEMKDYDFGLDFLHPEFKEFVLAYKPSLALARN
jgi:tyrosine-protein phosphatase SIW14